MELWIKILPFFALITFTWCLQGIPTWICLGISSPFINFHGYQEVLVNDSISLNVTKDEQALMHQEGLKKMGSLIKPNHIRDAVTGLVKANYTKKIQSQVGRRKKHWMYNAVQEELDQKPIYILDEDVDENGLPASLTEEDKKFIVPMALKTASSTMSTATIPSTTSTTTTQKPTTTTTAAPDFASNINELKNHILFLQNMTKHDNNFQSKFVVFPGMQKDRFGNIITSTPTTTTTTTTTKRTTVTSTTVRPVPTPSRSSRFNNNNNNNNDDDMMSSSRDKITIIPQVLLLNDQSSPDDVDEEMYGGMGARKKDNKLKQQKNQQRKKDLKRNNRRNLNPLRACVKNPTSLKCERQKRRLAAQQAMNSTGTASTGLLQRSIRSHKTSRNINWESFIFDSGTEYTLPANIDIDNISELTGANQTVHMYTDDDINLNPENCQKVAGFTYGQRKLCLRHISVMPAISRGARAAIQECQHQFRNRRWNCSTTDEDSSVFGTVSAIGSPEMAFVYALSSAMVTSFLARACRDGQLHSCGCSRGYRPGQLHDDWSWGGCGDNLDFAYRFSQEFVDIKERERKRGTRGLSAMQRSNFEKDSAAAAAASSSFKKEVNSTVSNANVTEKSVSSESENKETIDPTIIRELQERITKEILNSKLQEKDMQELKEKINKEILNSALINGKSERRRKQNMQNDSPMEETSSGSTVGGGAPRLKNGLSAKARSQMNLHNNEAGRRAVLRKSKILCKCHGVSGSCSLITCWQQLSSIREIGDYLREKYEGAIEVKLNKRGQLQVRHEEYKVQTPHDLVYLDDSPDWCRVNKQLQWPGTHGRVCNKTSSGLDGCGILCCGRGYNTKTLTVVEKCHCRFHWCCEVKCETCVQVREEHTCK